MSSSFESWENFCESLQDPAAIAHPDWGARRQFAAPQSRAADLLTAVGSACCKAVSARACVVRIVAKTVPGPVDIDSLPTETIWAGAQALMSAWLELPEPPPPPTWLLACWVDGHSKLAGNRYNVLHPSGLGRENIPLLREWFRRVGEDTHLELWEMLKRKRHLPWEYTVEAGFLSSHASCVSRVWEEGLRTSIDVIYHPATLLLKLGFVEAAHWEDAAQDPTRTGILMDRAGICSLRSLPRGLSRSALRSLLRARVTRQGDSWLDGIVPFHLDDVSDLLGRDEQCAIAARLLASPARCNDIASADASSGTRFAAWVQRLGLVEFEAADGPALRAMRDSPKLAVHLARLDVDAWRKATEMLTFEQGVQLVSWRTARALMDAKLSFWKDPPVAGIPWPPTVERYDGSCPKPARMLERVLHGQMLIHARDCRGFSGSILHCAVLSNSYSDECLSLDLALFKRTPFPDPQAEYTRKWRLRAWEAALTLNRSIRIVSLVVNAFGPFTKWERADMTNAGVALARAARLLVPSRQVLAPAAAHPWMGPGVLGGDLHRVLAERPLCIPPRTVHPFPDATLVRTTGPGFVGGPVRPRLAEFYVYRDRTAPPKFVHAPASFGRAAGDDDACDDGRSEIWNPAVGAVATIEGSSPAHTALGIPLVADAIMDFAFGVSKAARGGVSFAFGGF